MCVRVYLSISNYVVVYLDVLRTVSYNPYDYVVIGLQSRHVVTYCLQETK